MEGNKEKKTAKKATGRRIVLNTTSNDSCPQSPIMEYPRGFKKWCNKYGWKIEKGNVKQRIGDRLWRNCGSSMSQNDLIRMFYGI